MVQNSHAGEEGTHWSETNKASYHFTWGTFHSTKTFENLETAAMVPKFPEKFPEILETVEFPKCEPFNRKFWNSGSKVEWKGNFRENIFENLGIPREVLLFFGNFGKCCSIRYWKLPKISNRTFSLNGKRPRCTCTHGCFVQ